MPPGGSGRALDAGPGARPAGGARRPPGPARLARRLEAGMGRSVREVLGRARALADERGVGLYLAGGAVRDLLLGRPALDIDLVVEGEGLALARELASRCGVEARVHRELLTASFHTADGLTVDVATSRAETYERPGVLPRVRPAPIAEDLGRRDFALNAMALRLAPPPWPRLVDPLGGWHDLEARRLRVLHDASFRDDPTRILRGVRYEVRLGLTWEATTAEQARRALAEGALAAVSGDRLRGELVALFDEPATLAAAARALERRGVPRGLDPEVQVDAAALRRLERCEAMIGALPPETLDGRRPRRWLLALAAVGWPAPAAAERLAARLSLAPAEARVLAGGRDRVTAAAAALAAAELAPHRAAEAMAGLEVEELLLLAATGGAAAREWARRELEVHRRLDLAISGADLLARGFAEGPGIGRALAATRRARLDGLISAGEELEFAAGWLRRGGSG